MITHTPVEIKFNVEKINLLELTNEVEGVNLTDSVLDINYGFSEHFGLKQFVVKHQLTSDFIWGSLFSLDFHQKLLMKFVVCQNTGLMTIDRRDPELEFKRMQLIVTRGSANSLEVQKYLAG